MIIHPCDYSTLAKKLSELQATQRPIAKALGVSEATVNRDLNVTNVTARDIGPAQVDAPTVTDVTPAQWLQQNHRDIVNHAEAE
jgi:hypothetical protein